MSAQLKVAVVYGTLPDPWEARQLSALPDNFQVTLLTSQVLATHLSKNVPPTSDRFEVIGLPDHDDPANFLPGLDSALAGYDIVIVKERLGLYAYQAVKAKWRFGFRLILWVDNLMAWPAQDIERSRTVRDEITQNADGIWVQTEAAQAALASEGIASEKVHLVRPWIDVPEVATPDEIAAARGRLGWQPDERVILSFGQMEWEEGPLDLLHALALTRYQAPTVVAHLRVAFCGIGSFASDVRQRSIDLGLSEVVKFYPETRETMADLMVASHAGYISQIATRDRLEGDPYRLLRAAAAGLPLIASRSPLVEAIIEKHRFDFCAGSLPSLARAMRKALHAGSLRQSIIDKGRAKVRERFTVAEFLAAATPLLAPPPAEVPVDSTGAMVAEVEAKVRVGDYIAAVDLIERVNQTPDLPRHVVSHLHRLVGDCFTKLGDHEAGRSAYLRALEDDRHSARSYVGLGTISLATADYEVAVVHFQKAVGLGPRDEMANLGLGLAFQGLDESVEAIKWIKVALEINPTNTAAIYSLVRLAGEIDRLDDAIGALKDYLAVRRDDHHIRYTLGGVYFQRGHHQDCIDLMEEIIADNPMDARAQSLLKQARKTLIRRQKAAAQARTGGG